MDDQQQPTPSVSSDDTTPPSPPISKEESILQSASEGVDEIDDQPNRVVLPPAPEKKSHKKLWIALLLLVVIVGGGGAAFALLGSKKETPAASSSTGTPVVEKKATQTFSPDKVSYAYRTAEADPYTVFYRPTAGGERKEVTKLDRDEYVSNMDVKGNVAAFLSGKKIFLSKDGGTTYKAVYTVEAGEDVISLKIAGDGSRITFSTFSTASADVEGKIYSLNTSGSDKQELVTSAKYALFVQAYSPTTNRLAYAEGCYGCDSGYSAIKLYDLKKKTAEDLLDGADIKTLEYTMAFSDDMKVVTYIKHTVDTSIAIDGIPGYYTGAPYSIMQVDVASGESKVVKTIGTKQEKNANGTYKYRQFFLGFLAGTSTPYYAEDTNIYRIVSLKPELLYTSDKALGGVYFVSDKNVIVGTELPANEYTLSNYDLTTKKSVLIFEGNINTSIIGVSTK